MVSSVNVYDNYLIVIVLLNDLFSKHGLIQYIEAIKHLIKP